MSPLDICFQIDKYTNNNADAQLQYTTSGQKEIFGLFKKICLIKHADNKKNRKLIVMLWSRDLNISSRRYP